MDFRHFWYIAAESRQLRAGDVRSVRILDEWIALFRDESGQVVALQDRCMHRSSQISRGRVVNGCLQCPYHGWTYNGAGEVVLVPSEGPDSKVKRRPAKKFRTLEKDDYIYVCLSDEVVDGIQPFSMPYYGQKGWQTIRLVNRFRNNVTNCAENFVDIPHTVFVHPTIFRSQADTYQKFGAHVQRKKGSVIVTYKNETKNFGIFSWFLNPSGKEIIHTDSFHMPNVTHVEYIFGENRHFNITSQSVPTTDDDTLVYTDLTYDYGIWSWLARPIIRWQGQAIIDQDIDVLDNQMKTIKKYGDQFQNSPADVIHILIESIRNEIQNGRDPRLLVDKEHEVEFWV